MTIRDTYHCFKDDVTFSGMSGAAAVMFPDAFLFSADYDYYDSSGNVDCNATQDTIDMCTNTTAMAISQANGTCSQQIAFSGIEFHLKDRDTCTLDSKRIFTCVKVYPV